MIFISKRLQDHLDYLFDHGSYLIIKQVKELNELGMHLGLIGGLCIQNNSGDGIMIIWKKRRSECRVNLSVTLIA